MANSCSRDDLLCSLVLFACSAKLWLALNNNHHKQRQSRHRRPSTKIKDQNNNNDVTKKLKSPRSIRLPRKSYNHSPWPVIRSNGAIHEHEEENGSINDKKSPHSKSREDRLFLMERVSMSDSVLTRETSFDFHPKNSNWSHFENYTPTFSPPRNIIVENKEEDEEEEEEDQDFLWSEPPTTTRSKDAKDSMDDTTTTSSQQYTDNSLLNNKNYNRQKSSEKILHFNAGCLPSKLIMIRHGQSEGNVDELLYATKPDNAMHLTKLGWEMARMSGRALREQLPPGETVHFIVSPYARTVETFHGIVSAWSDPDDFAHIPNRSRRLKLWYTKLMEMGLTWHEDPRIREQDFGNYQDPQVIKKAKRERHQFGSFYYRFPHGESASDVFDRVSTFLDSLWRSFESGRAQNYVLVAHGISIRVFLTRYFRYSIDQFHMLANPKNCEMIILAHDGLGRLKLDGRCELELQEVEGKSTKDNDEGRNHQDEVGETRASEKEEDGAVKSITTTMVTGYKKSSRLRTLPPQWVRSRTVRMCYNDT